ncbi:MAG TPA: tRNA uridine-5-carboxymethylaminomethyl(34) synthesis enzyme MnmG [Candidatus Krumholzibacteria bacterium]|nr:tRNA uridine-5-carboxymethylaminomethyl(34) synthesis enzyme MnmG [Candidatus Krumholzibacteria bacterium]
MDRRFDIIVIGGGHAGCEAALAAARMGMHALLSTLRRDRIGHMPCNPAVGGLAKGHLVKELDALGGEIGRATDRAGIQFRMLNRAKGPAVWSPRAQVDKVIYSRIMRETLEAQPGLTIVEGEIVDLIVNQGAFVGVRFASGEIVNAGACVLTTGTFLRGLMHTGDRRTDGGREGEPPAATLSESLRSLGLRMGRLKTGTPPRVFRDSVDLSRIDPQPGDDPPAPFSYRTARIELPQVPCHLTYTSEATHEVIRRNLHRSPLYGGAIEGIGPRYCPSIEDKVVRFADKDRHQVFIEPEGLDHPELYLNGISTSLPVDVQLEILSSIPGLESARMARPGYAVEYDFFPPDQLHRTMESKCIERLYFAGQVNGTSGYEEAAAQGFLAGVNAVLKIQGEAPFVPRRNEAYLGVLVDDLTTKEIDEPYRMFTSRAEFRLVLRQDNADERLMATGHRFGLVPERALATVRERVRRVDEVVDALGRRGFPAREGAARFDEWGLEPVRHGTTLRDVLRRPGVRLAHLRDLAGLDCAPSLDDAVECRVKYEGYIDRQARDVQALSDLEARRIPPDFAFEALAGLSTEAREKLRIKRPETLGQASRIAGVRASDLSILAVHVERARRTHAG